VASPVADDVAPLNRPTRRFEGHSDRRAAGGERDHLARPHHPFQVMPAARGAGTVAGPISNCREHCMHDPIQGR
jgi:hypothetical protein